MGPFLLLSLFFFSTAYARQALPWDQQISAPEIMSPSFDKTFSKLPLNGEYTRPGRLWSGDYWPFYKNGIDNRWFAKTNHERSVNPPDRKTALKSSIHSLATLSPAEKYDLFIGRYDYPVKRWVRSLIPIKPQLWEGICHGWSPASINHEEPRPRVMKNPDGIEVPFSSADIKALLSFYYAFGFEVNTTNQMGRRCESGSLRTNDENCFEDLNAGAFHIVLTNKLGILNESFIVDNQRLREVWNNPIRSYKSQILAQLRPLSESAPGTVSVVKVKTMITYVESIRPQWQTTLGTKHQQYRNTYYEYYLDLDEYDQIIGGKWISKERPDFIWQKRRPARFAGLLSELGRLLLE